MAFGVYFGVYSMNPGPFLNCTNVFDALVSRRSYKEPFSFENAMQIIQEDSGSRFDPSIVDAFCRAEEEVRRVMNSVMGS